MRKDVPVKVGGVLDLPYLDESFDFVFSSEVLEHSLLPENALREMLRILARGGKLLVIDKNVKRLGQLALYEMEQWFDSDKVVSTLESFGVRTRVIEGVPYENGGDDLFTAWIVEKEKNDSGNLSAADWHKAIVAYQDIEALASDILAGKSLEWLEPLLKSTSPGETCLELGSGTGVLSAALAMHGRKVILLDFSKESLDFSRRLFERLSLDATYIHSDMLKEFPLDDNSCDCVWSSGVLEHFSDDEIIHIISESARVSRKLVISLVPNAASVFYRIGKWHQEKIGKWTYGYEEPKFSMKNYFEHAGLIDTIEYSIDEEHALKFIETFPEYNIIIKKIKEWYLLMQKKELKN